MTPLRGLPRLFLAVLIFSVTLSAQKQAPASPPQTARQALLEMIKGGPQNVTKHLTVEVQQLLSKPENSTALAAMGMFGSLGDQAGSNVHTFETGPLLLSMEFPREHAKFEVRMENDDLAGDEDTMALSLHRLHDGQEQQVEDWADLLSGLSVTMVRQQNVWRLSKIGVGVDLKLGDPEFVQKIFLNSGRGVGMVGVNVGPESHAELKAAEPGQPADLPPSQALTMLAFAEHSYASQHPDVGFTCSLGELAEAGKQFVPNQQVAAGIYSAYKLSLSGCQGKPAGSFQISLEPVSPGSGGKAYCTDATQNVRTSDDGRGATCLAAGRPENSAATQGESIGFDVVSGSTPKN